MSDDYELNNILTFTTTNAGVKALTDVLESTTKIVFTKMETSNIYYTDEQIKELKSLPDINQKADITGLKRTSDTTIEITTYIENTELEQGYFIRSIGLYAVDIDGNEILFGVASEDNPTANYLSAYQNKTVMAVAYTFVLKIDDSNCFVIDMSSAVYATLMDLEELKEWVNANNTIVEDNLFSYSGENALSANQGRILNNMISDINNTISNVAKETSNYKIENDIASLKSSVDGVAKETSLSGVAKESSNYSIENYVKTINTQATSISTAITSQNTTIGTLAKETSLSGMAKETSNYSIENYVKDLKTEISSIKTTCSSISSAVVPETKWWELPNIFGRKMQLYNTTVPGYDTLTTVYTQYGSGHLISLNLPILFYGYASSETASVQVQILLDGSIKFNHQLDVSFSETTRLYFPIGFGIHNIQDGYNIGWNNSATTRYSYTTLDPYLKIASESATSTAISFSRSLIAHNQLPYDRYSENTYIKPISLGSTLQTHETGTYAVLASNVRNMYSLVHFYDGTSISFSNSMQIKVKIDCTSAATTQNGYGGLELTLA